MDGSGDGAMAEGKCSRVEDECGDAPRLWPSWRLMPLLADIPRHLALSEVFGGFPGRANTGVGK